MDGEHGDASQSVARPSSVWMEPARVLVVDDYEDTAKAFAMLLEQLGHDVRIATSGREALAVARAFEPDLVLLDIQLPDLVGYEVAERLRADAGSRPLGLIALTGLNTRQQCLAAGFDAYALKPVDLATLDLHMRLARELSRGSRS